MVTIAVIIAILVLAGIFFYNRKNRSLDINQDGKVNSKDVKVAVKSAAVSAKADVAKVGTTVKRAAARAKKAASKKV